MSVGPGNKQNVDSVYYRDGVGSSAAMSVLMKARMAIFELFMSRMQLNAKSTILDIGVSDDENEGANFLEKHYPYQHNITCAGIGDGEAVLRAYPGVKFRRIEPGKPLPYADGEFDIACSNAVLEHVGGPDMRAAFIKEHLRVARSVFITIPNRWFPIEHHTKIPLLHYAPELFRKSIAGTRLRYWARPSNLEFLDRQLIFREWPIAAKPEVVFTGIPLGRLSSNLAIIVKR